MRKVNIILIICTLVGEYFQLVRVILKKGVTRFSHIWQFFGVGFLNWTLEKFLARVLTEGQVSKVGNLTLRG